jgi:hypothetical protein
LETERRQREEQNRLEHVPQSQLPGQVAPLTPTAQPETDKSSAETPKVVLPMPQRLGESEHEKLPQPSSGSIASKSLSADFGRGSNSLVRCKKWVINESILASLTGCFRPAIKKFVETHRSFINQANNTHGLGPGHNRGKARTNPDAIPELVKNFKRDALGQPF